MSYEIAGRMSWLVSWLDHWRGHAYSNGTARSVVDPARPRAWTNWLQNVSSGAASTDEELISHSLAAKHLRESVEQLPSQQRQVLLLHVNNGLTYWEIAARLGVEEDVVLHDLARAYSKLRLELSMDELRR